jgi:uncharacterized protein YggE
MRRGSAPVLLASWIVVLASFAAQSALAADIDKAERTVIVSATGSVKAEPDIARIFVGVITEAETARDAFACNKRGDLRFPGVAGFPGDVRFGAARAAQIEAGTQDLEVAVHVVYRLQ